MKIFVSHHHKDATQLSNIKYSFSGLGIEMFLAHEDIKPGEHDLKTMQEYIKESCDIFLLIGSKDALKSHYVQQEIGLALGTGKPIISTIDKTNANTRLLGFIAHQQAISFKLLEELYELIYRELSKGKYKEHWCDTFKQAITNGWPLFQVSDSSSQGIVLKSNNSWNDYGYCTSFAIYKDGERAGWAKIGFKGQCELQRTESKIPKKFHILPKNFFSFVSLDDSNKKLSKEEKRRIYAGLNDVNHFPKIAKQHWEEPVLKKSLFRDDPELHESLRKKIKK